MRILFDTNVVLDLLLDREPHVHYAAALFAEVEHGGLTGFLGATTLTTVHYLATKVIGEDRASKEIAKLLRLFEVAPVNRSVLEAALEADLPDFEDAVLAESARQADADGIVTRNSEDFRRANITVYSPQELVAILRSGGD